ncbi:hypothetical protein HYW55_00065 [Candidatus Gottesmanbacteria bacterium]|nr:hypothetical protein [Candidatus Gottesmanbacteria bacterium]
MNLESYLKVLRRIIGLFIGLSATSDEKKAELSEKISQRFVTSFLLRFIEKLPSDKFSELEKGIAQNSKDQQKILQEISIVTKDIFNDETNAKIALEEMETIVKDLLTQYKSTVSPKAWEVTQKTIDGWLNEIPNEESDSPVAPAIAA